MYRLIVLCHCVQWYIVQSIHCLLVLHTVPSVCSVSLPPMLSFLPSVSSVSLRPLVSCKVSLLSVSTSYCNVGWFCFTASTGVLYNLSTVCHYLSMYHLFVLCHCAHWCLLQSLHCLPVLRNVPSVCSLSLRPLVFCTVCPLSLITSYCTVSWFCVTVSTAVLYSLSTLCPIPLGSMSLRPLVSCTVCPLSLSLYFIIYRSLVLCRCLHWCVVQSIHCLSVPHTLPPVGSVTSSTGLLYSLSTLCQNLTFYLPLFPCRLFQ